MTPSPDLDRLKMLLGQCTPGPWIPAAYSWLHIEIDTDDPAGEEFADGHREHWVHSQGAACPVAGALASIEDTRQASNNAALIALTPTLAAQVLSLSEQIARDDEIDRLRQETIERQEGRIAALAEENGRLRAALKQAEEWLSGWASAEPYLETIRAALEGTPKCSA